MLDKVVSIDEAIADLNDGAVLMVGGFMANGTSELIMDALVKKGVKNLTIICNDGGWPDRGVGKLIGARQVTRLITSHVGLNPTVAGLVNEGFLKLELVPQGTLVERINCGGKGMGGFYTPTGVGTWIEEGGELAGMVGEKKESKIINGKKYILELPLRADFALLRGSVTDRFGNTTYNKTTRNFNPVMATAADKVIVATEKLVNVGEILPEVVVTPGVFVDYVVEGEPKCQA